MGGILKNYLLATLQSSLFTLISKFWETLSKNVSSSEILWFCCSLINNFDILHKKYIENMSENILGKNELGYFY